MYAYGRSVQAKTVKSVNWRTEYMVHRYVATGSVDILYMKGLLEVTGVFTETKILAGQEDWIGSGVKIFLYSQ